jgi:hypothetical protein
MPTLNLISRDNGVGLSRDLHLLAGALRSAGFDVHVTAIRGGKLRKWFGPTVRRANTLWRRLRGGSSLYDANVMLERIRPEYLPHARRNFLVPNPEWFPPSEVPLLERIDAVLTKTTHAGEIFAALGCRIASIGFTSEDRFDPDVPRERSFFHLAGRSGNKGTQPLIELWRRHPEWPLLTVLQHPSTAQPIEPTANLVQRLDYISDAELRRLQNANAFHLCPSETEGFGHYLIEAMSVGAVTLTTDAPPMNELVTPNRGVLVAFGRTGRQQLATTYHFDEAAMEAAIERALAMSQAEREDLGANARDWFLRNDREFSTRLQQALVPLLA